MTFIKLSNLSVARKLNLILIASCVGIISMSVQSLFELHNTLLSSRQHEIQRLVENAHTVALHVKKLSDEGRITEEAAKDQTLSAIKDLRYGKDGYFWVQDTNVKMIMHPFKPSLNGKDLSGLKDPTGKLFFKEMNEAVKNPTHGGFVNYMWPFPGKDEPVAKISYVKSIPGWDMIIGTGIYIDNVNEKMLSESVIILGSSLTILLLLFLISSTIARNISRPVTLLTDDTTALAGGDSDHHISSTERGDEIGEMARALQVFKTSLKDAKSREIELQATAEAERKATLNELANSLEADVVTIIDAVSESAAVMHETATSMSNATDLATEQTNVVANASSQASSNVQNVAAAAEELYNSITEISRQVAQSSDITRQANDQVTDTRDKVHALNEAATQISEVVELITDIADQTNLLALNATIEAARAGDAGKGFAVVANEVKNLANQTARATGEISEKISQIQGETQATVAAISAITEVIQNLDSVASSIASAVEEQGAATQEIARNVQEASDGTDEVNRSIAGITEVAKETGSSANQVAGAAENVSHKTEQLREVVQTFLSSLRSS